MIDVSCKEIYQESSHRLKDDYDFQYFEHLDDSITYCKRRASKHYEMDRVVATVWKSLSEDFTSNYKITITEQKENAIRNIFSNCLVAFERGDVLAIPLDNTKWTSGKKYKITYSNQVPETVHELKRTGWINLAPACYYGKNDIRNRNTRIWISETLAQAFRDIVPYEHIYQDFKELIIVRDSNKQDMFYSDIPYSNKLRKDIRKYNHFMREFKVEYTKLEREKVDNVYFEQFSFFRPNIPNFKYQYKSYMCKKEKQLFRNYPTSYTVPVSPIDGLLSEIVVKYLLSSDLTCVFNRGETKDGKSFKLGGRFYTGAKGHQSITKKERGTITIDGKPTVELDYKSLHIAMLYALEKEQIKDDPYIVKGKEELRDFTKKILLTGLNAKSEKSTLWRIWQDVFELLTKEKVTLKEEDLLVNILRLKPDWKELVKGLNQRHRAIEKYTFNDTGIHLMNKDARIMRTILMSLVKEDIPCLPMHDSVIVQEKHKDALRKVMEDSYKKHMNRFKCEVEEK